MAQATVEAAAVEWFERDDQDNPVVYLYFFWSKQCPHCLEALPYLEALEEEYDWLRVKKYQLLGNQDNVMRYQRMARSLGKNARSIPGFLFCNTMLTGFGPRSTPGALESELNRCHEHLQNHTDLGDYTGSLSQFSQAAFEIELPLLGKVTLNHDSLPLITMVIASVDAFNPCAFFVLMFLLGMMLHTNSRKRMLLVGGIFVFFSGLLYFLFMTAWFNLFRVIGQLDIITTIAATVAIVIGVINTKDFFWYKQGISLTIADSARPGLYQRVRYLVRARSLFTVILATIGLSLFANLYEFLCTAGFPMVYTRILTLNELPISQYYLYLALYNIIYVLPLLIIVLVISLTLGRKKLQQQEGRALKLISGMMMLALGGVLLADPNILNNIVATLGIILLVVGFALILIIFDNWRHHTSSNKIK